MSRINYSYITDKGSKWNLTLNREQDIKPFYDSLVNRMTEAGILLRHWDQIIKDESLAVITADNCDNFESAHQSMSQAIFNYLDQNKNTIFKKYSIPRGYIEGYRSNSDGFNVLYQTLTANHPALVDLVSSKEDPVKPTLDSHHNNIYTFCNALKDYYDYEYKGMSHRPVDHQRKVIKYIRAQLQPDRRYELAIRYIDKELKRIYEDRIQPLPFPNALTLEGTVAVTLMKELPQATYEEINETIATESSATDYQINKAFTRQDKHNSRQQQSQRYNKKTTSTSSRKLFEKLKNKHSSSDEPPRTPIDAICAACGKSGHDINHSGCDAMAQFQLLLKYK